MNISREEVNAIVDAKIKAHELRIGFISGIAGFAFIFALAYAFSIVLSS